ncbi:MAG: flagellar hook-basal body protein [Myxococcota bacterium]
MSRELYSGVSGATAAWSQLDVVSHNLANSSTAGFKARKLTFQLAEGADNGGVLGQAYVEPGGSNIDLSTGAPERTDRDLDLAIQGEGFFTLQGQNGDTLYTRNGQFTQDQQGFVVTFAGDQLMSTAGPVQLQQGEQLVVGEGGALSTTNGDDRGFLQIAGANPEDLEPVGATLFKINGPVRDLVQDSQSLGPTDKPMTILQRHLERSNVNPMGAMVELIEASRYFEAYQNLMKASDEADNRLSSMGRS